MSFLTDRKFLAINLDHVIVDIYIGERAVLFTYIAAQLGKTNAWLGLMTMLGLMAGGLAQPFFGWIVDKGGFKWLVVGGLAWIVAFYAAAAVFPIQWAPFFIIIAMLGSAAFHPAGSFQAQTMGKSDNGARETTATALFFLFGNFGFVIGPLLGGILLTLHGMAGSLWFVAAAIPLIIFSAWVLLVPGNGGLFARFRSAETQEFNKGSITKHNWSELTLVFIILTLQTWAQQNLYVYIPKNLSDLGISASIYGIMAAVFMAGSAVGNLFGGIWSDKKGRRSVVVVSLILASGPIFLLAWFPYSLTWYLLILTSGFATGISFSVLIVMAQNMIPLRPATASGFVLGWVFLTGAIGTQISGVIADQLNFSTVYLMTAIMVTMGGILAMWIGKEPNKK